MAEQTTPRAETPSAAVARLEPFTVEFGDNYCRNHVINCLRVRARGAWSVTRLHQREIGGRDIGTGMSTMPAIPGLRLRVVPREMKAYLEDPLTDDPTLMEQINSAIRKNPSVYKGVPYKPVETTTLNLSNDLLVTLLFELHRKLDEEQIVLTKGRLPKTEQINKLPGRELYDPWNNGRKPTYVDQVGEWHERLDSQQV